MTKLLNNSQSTFNPNKAYLHPEWGNIDFTFPCEVWLDVIGYKGYYKISNWGRVLSLNRNIKVGVTTRNQKTRLLKQMNLRGYFRVCLAFCGYNKNHPVHRLVTTAFLMLPTKNLQVNHKNGVKSDNRLSNLEWVTPSQNTIHAYSMGLIRTRLGEECYNSKLIEKQVKYIRAIKGKVRNQDLARAFNVSPTTISDVWNNKIWKHVK